MADSAWTYAVGNIAEHTKKLLKVTENALYKGIEKAGIGNRIGDIGHAMALDLESMKNR